MQTRRCGLMLLVLLTTSIAGAQSSPSAAGAPSPPSATTVLSNVETFYAKPSQLTAKFRQVVTNATFNTSRNSDGALWVAKPNSFRFEYVATKGKVTKTFIFDGSTLWYIDHGNKQIFQNQTQGSVLPAAISFLTGGAALAAEFNVAIDNAGTYGGKNATVLELTPKQPSAQYKQLFFVVDASDWHIRESIVVASNGDTNAFQFFTPNLKPALQSSLFKFNPASLPTYKLVAVQHASAAGTGSASTASGSASGVSAAPSNPRP
ncbi:MAG: outer rane lipoprotein carrier protein LolA [Myxococcales bacterium]|nr:outer rane lipoprotein carrier protein LolA [Myxococcales bacterium]